MIQSVKEKNINDINPETIIEKSINFKENIQ